VVCDSVESPAKEHATKVKSSLATPTCSGGCILPPRILEQNGSLRMKMY
jgi:hypothetical protein